MSNIEIPGYNCRVPNSVYSREVKDFIHPLFGRKESTEFLILNYFRYPSKEEILRKVIESSKNYLNRSKNKKVHKNCLEYSFSKLPENMVSSIADNDKSLIELIKKFINRHNLIKNKYYFATYNGIIINTSVSQQEKNAIKNYQQLDSLFYSDLIKNNDSNDWSMILKLDENKRIPDKSILESLIIAKTKDSELLNTNIDFSQYNKLKNQFNNIYNIISNSENIMKINDSTLETIEDMASDALEEITKRKAIILPRKRKPNNKKQYSSLNNGDLIIKPKFLC